MAIVASSKCHVPQRSAPLLPLTGQGFLPRTVTSSLSRHTGISAIERMCAFQNFLLHDDRFHIRVHKLDGVLNSDCFASCFAVGEMHGAIEAMVLADPAWLVMGNYSFNGRASSPCFAGKPRSSPPGMYSPRFLRQNLELAFRRQGVARAQLTSGARIDPHKSCSPLNTTFCCWFNKRSVSHWELLAVVGFGAAKTITPFIRTACGARSQVQTGSAVVKGPQKKPFQRFHIQMRRKRLIRPLSFCPRSVCCVSSKAIKTSGHVSSSCFACANEAAAAPDSPNAC